MEARRIYIRSHVIVEKEHHAPFSGGRESIEKRGAFFISKESDSQRISTHQTDNDCILGVNLGISPAHNIGIRINLNAPFGQPSGERMIRVHNLNLRLAAARSVVIRISAAISGIKQFVV